METEKKGEPYINDPSYEPLTGHVGRAAVNGQIFAYPKVLRQKKDPPVPNQNLSLLSFHVFEQPKTIVDKNGKTVKIRGMAKCRGVYEEKDQAVRASAQIVRDIDSVFKIGISEVGAWVPIVEDVDAFSKDTVPLDTEEEMEKQREMEELRAQKRKKAEEEQRLRKQEERAKEAALSDPSGDPESLDYTTMQNTTWLGLFRTRETLKEQVKNITWKLKTQHEILEYLRRRHPEYYENDAWLELANKQRAETSIMGEKLLPNEREAFNKRIEQTRLPQNISREPKRVMINLDGPKNDKENFEIIYPEYEEDYQIREGDSEEDKIHKAHNLKAYRDKLALAEEWDRKAMAAVCPWKLDEFGRILKDAPDQPKRLPPGTEDEKEVYPETEGIAEFVPVDDPEKHARQEVFPGLEPPEAKGGDVFLHERRMADSSKQAQQQIIDKNTGKEDLTLIVPPWKRYTSDQIKADETSEVTETDESIDDLAVRSKALVATTYTDGTCAIRFWMYSGKETLIRGPIPEFMKLPKEWAADIGKRQANMVRSYGEAGNTRAYQFK